ncbi:MAG: hypothetical protein IPM54_16800 [Polyangiaceae bacterium]|nr:hypothetical protein [Polyangiaceae bacterium]
MPSTNVAPVLIAVAPGDMDFGYRFGWRRLLLWERARFGEVCEEFVELEPIAKATIVLPEIVGIVMDLALSATMALVWAAG